MALSSVDWDFSKAEASKCSLVVSVTQHLPKVLLSEVVAVNRQKVSAPRVQPLLLALPEGLNLPMVHVYFGMVLPLRYSYESRCLLVDLLYGLKKGPAPRLDPAPKRITNQKENVGLLEIWRELLRCTS